MDSSSIQSTNSNRDLDSTKQVKLIKTDYDEAEDIKLVSLKAEKNRIQTELESK
jgi:hypothetical protein